LGSRMAVLPISVRRDFGRLSPGGRFARYRRRYDDVIAELIAKARRDPNSDERSDVLSLLLAARYDDGQPISDSHVADELFTLLAAGHHRHHTGLGSRAVASSPGGVEPAGGRG
jgi:cytochrome P450